MKRIPLRNFQNAYPDRYKLARTDPNRFFSSGCGLLNRVLGGGYVVGRMENIIGDKSTGKTLLWIEAAANFKRKFPNGKIRVAESEDAFDLGYARSQGLPKDGVEFLSPKPDTIEEVYEDIVEFCSSVKKSDGGMYVVDSWDALSDKAEMEAKIDKASYGTGKARQASRMFRKLTRLLGKKNVTLFIISQIRDNIGVMFGEKHTRAGGRALDFYATHCLWLAQTKKVKVKKKSVERVIGISIRANCKKNKVCAPFRTCDFPIIFYYGVDDLAAGANWLVEVKRGREIGIDNTFKAATEFISKSNKLDDDEYNAERDRVNKVVRRVWEEVENLFAPTRRKYS